MDMALANEEAVEEVTEAVDQALIDSVVDQMIRDIEMGDQTAIEELLKSVPEDDLRAFQSEVEESVIEEVEVEEGFVVGAKVAPEDEGPDQAPGTVVKVNGDKVTVKFMDGSQEEFAQDELFALPDDLKVGEEVEEEAVEEAIVEIPVQELADIMQLAGYANYAERIEEYANEPDEQYMDAEDQLIGLSGGLNGPKNMHTPASGGDNPMDKEALKTVEENLYKSYKDFLEEAELTEKE